MPPRQHLSVGQPDRPGPARQHAARLRHRLRQRRRQRLPGRPRLRRAPACSISCAIPTPRSPASCSAAPRTTRPRPDRTGQHLRHPDRAESLQRSRHALSPPSTAPTARGWSMTGTAFDSTYLLPLAHRTPGGRRDAMAHLGSYLFHELTTPLGLRLERTRLPRGGACRSAASAPTASGSRAACCCAWRRAALASGFSRNGRHRRSTHGLSSPTSILSCPSMVWSDWENSKERPRFRRRTCWRRPMRGLWPTRSCCRTPWHSHLGNGRPPLESSPRELLTRLLAAIEEQSQQMVAHDDPAPGRGRRWCACRIGWAAACNRRARQRRGPPAKEPADTGAGSERRRSWPRSGTSAGFRGRRPDGASGPAHRHRRGRPGPLPPSLPRKRRKPGHACSNRPAGRNRARTSYKTPWTAASRAAAALAGSAANRVACCGSSSIISPLSRGSAWPRTPLAAVQQFYGFLQGRLDDRLRDLTFCRQRLRHMQEALAQMPATPEPERRIFPSTNGRGHRRSPAAWTTVRRRCCPPNRSGSRSANRPRPASSCPRGSRTSNRRPGDSWTP